MTNQMINMDLNNSIKTCFICYEEYSTTRNSAITICGHQFCLECIIKHCQLNTSCPMCRDSLVKKPVKKCDKWKYDILDEIRERLT